jgi:predicted N-acyltransferase
MPALVVEDLELAGWQIRRHLSPQDIAAEHWDALLDQSPAPTPFMTHAWLSALHDSQCASPQTGWTLQMFTAHAPGRDPAADTPDAVCVTYLKTHSYGEYVFDWAWARAYEQHGLPYYPKLLGASPFTPVPGSRLLASSQQARLALAQGLRLHGQQAELSSAHVLYPDAQDRAAFEQDGWLIRHGVQFHWQNRNPQPYADLPEFLGEMQREKRKKIQQERRKVADAGVVIEARQGAQIREQDWDFFYTCYRNTYLAHGGPPYLSREFFAQVAQTMAEHWLIFTAVIDGQPVAASLVAVDLARGVAWGRYWGAVAHIPCLHFELCYYSPLQWCIDQGFVRFEGGAQGEHKMARGLMPVPTCSAHWLADERFAHAVEDFLQREGAGVAAYVDELTDRTPFKAPC